MELSNDYDVIKKFFVGNEKDKKIFHFEKIKSYSFFVNDKSEIPSDDILSSLNNYKIGFLNDREIDINAIFEIKLLFMDTDNGIDYYWYVKYNNKVYKIELNYMDEKYFPKDIKLVYEPKGIEGTRVLYDGDGDGKKENWIVLYDDGENIEIISEKVIGDLSLGSSNYNDNSVEKIKENINIYNNLISILNNYCKELIKGESDKSKIRNVGAYSDITDEYYNSEYIGAYNNLLKKGDRLYEQDIIRIIYWNIENVNDLYYISSRYSGGATRYVAENGDIANLRGAIASFNARIIGSSDYIDYYGLVGDDTMLIEIWKNNEIFTSEQRAGVRPIVKNPTIYEIV